MKLFNTFLIQIGIPGLFSIIMHCVANFCMFISVSGGRRGTGLPLLLKISLFKCISTVRL